MNKPNGMLGAAFAHEVTNVSKIFGRQHDINVVIEGDQAGVDPDGNIVYPSIDQDAQLSEEEIRISRGYVDHECGHKRHTNLPAFFRYGRKCKEEGKGLLMGIANAMEDPRMEAKVIQDYQGAFDNLTATANEVSRSWTEHHADTVAQCIVSGEPDEHWYHYVGGALSILGRGDCWGFEGKHYDSALATFEAIMGKANMDQCRKFSKQLARCKSTKAVLKLTDEVGEWIRAEFDQQQQQQQQSQQQGQDQQGQDQGQQGQDQQGQSQGQDQDSQNQQGGQGDQQDQGQDSDGNDSDGSGENSDDSGTDSDGNSQSNDPQGQDQGTGRVGQDQDGLAKDQSQGQGQGQGQEGQDQDDQGQGQSSTDQVGPLNKDGHKVEVPDILNKTLTKHTTVARAWSKYRPFSTALDQVHTRKNGTALSREMNYPSGRETYQELLRESAGQLNVVRRKLERALQADRNINWDGGKVHGRLDSRRLVAAFNRQEKVFKRKQETPALDTAVTFLLDMSASMNARSADARRITTATQSLICMAEALEKTSIAYNIMGHTIGRDEDVDLAMDRKLSQANLKDPLTGKYTRHAPLDMFEFKAFHERLAMAKQALGNAVGIVNRATAYCGNADSEALWHCYQLLKQRTEQRKVLIVLSDGKPNSGVSGEANETARKALKKAIESLEARGVEVIGIGIQTDTGEELYDKWHTVMKLDELGGTIMDELSLSLLGKRVSGKRTGRVRS